MQLLIFLGINLVNFKNYLTFFSFLSSLYDHTFVI